MELLTYMSLMGLKVGSQSCLDIRVKGGTGVFLRPEKLALRRLLDLFLLMVTLSLGLTRDEEVLLPAGLIDEKGSVNVESLVVAEMEEGAAGPGCLLVFIYIFAYSY